VARLTKSVRGGKADLAITSADFRNWPRTSRIRPRGRLWIIVCRIAGNGVAQDCRYGTCAWNACRRRQSRTLKMWSRRPWRGSGTRP